MNNAKYADTPALVQILGCITANVSLLDDEGKYFLTAEDFPKEFHQILFSAISNLHTMGTRQINVQAIEQYLQNKPVSYATYKANDGARFLKTAEENADLVNFDYYYETTKKFTLLREYANIGYDVSWIYDPDELNQQIRERKTQYFNSLSLVDIADLIDERIDRVRATYVDGSTNEAVNASDGIEEMFDQLLQRPDFGQPLYGKLVNTVTRGMRLGCFYLRSAATGVGKTRSLVADMCNCACDEIFDGKEWVDNGPSLPALFISTELELEELQTQMMAFISGVDEYYILNRTLEFEELERVKKAIEIIKRMPLYVEVIPDFNLKDIENCIKRAIRIYGVQYVALDYIHTSMKILEEITRRSGGVRLREDNILFLLSVKLKDIATQYNIFIISATQLNGDFKKEEMPDQTLLRGAKAIADKCDWGAVMLDVTATDLEKLENVLEDGMTKPNLKMSIYKNRRGRYTKCFLWMYVDKGTCRFDGLFLTDWNYELININDVQIRMR